MQITPADPGHVANLWTHCHSGMGLWESNHFRTDLAESGRSVLSIGMGRVWHPRLVVEITYRNTGDSHSPF